MTAGRSPARLVRVVRDGVEESVHLGHVAVCDPEGRLVAWAGDPGRLTFARSCMKPLQAAVSLAAMGPRERLRDEQVAVMCASHNGEPLHLRAVRSLLARGGLTAEDLRTPAARPLDPGSAVPGRDPTPLSHNCSGKHAGMLLASVRAGWPTLTYRRRSHPLQRRVTSAVRALGGAHPLIGVDGCGVPVHGLPLSAIATMYARFSVPSGQGDLAPFLARAMDAMRAAPYVVGGSGRDDTAVMQALPGVVMKEGAEALDCAVVLDRGLGIAVKVADGGERAVGPAIVAVLDRLGMLDVAARRALRTVAAPPVLGGGRPVGGLEVVLELRTA
jgi:L-asparaginase II